MNPARLPLVAAAFLNELADVHWPAYPLDGKKIADCLFGRDLILLRCNRSDLRDRLALFRNDDGFATRRFVNKRGEVGFALKGSDCFHGGIQYTSLVD